MQRFPTLSGLLLALILGCTVGCSGEKTGPLAGTISYGNTKSIEGEKWVLVLSGEAGKNYSTEVDASGKFSLPKVVEGGYKVQVTHYLPMPDASKPSKGPPGSTAPKQYNYPEVWTVPGGPYTLDLSKLKK